MAAAAKKIKIEAAASTVSLKLLIDSKARRVLFAEADKSFVDFLFHLLSFPLGSVIKLVSENSMVGSLGNLYSSIQNLSDTYLQPDANRDVLLNPKAPPILSSDVPLLPAGDDVSPPSDTGAVYACTQGCEYYSDDSESICPKCVKASIKCLMKYVAPVKTATTGGSTRDGSGSCSGFVKGVVTYMVMDDLKVMPHSTISTINVLNQYDIKDFGSLEVKVVPLGVDEGLKVLKASLQTKSVLTTVFLP
ncbi:uncharacterized protein LOC116000527 [Ipomoea triloba]|uniref:uncharacterized protein LOC116000527 n=1 Tax=Ipomoea triloba TaxID=35885 RepID=UPI00125DC2CF|nr:uncharacterized protein LOC116000527 [Ipomoea triloba]